MKIRVGIAMHQVLAFQTLNFGSDFNTERKSGTSAFFVRETISKETYLPFF
jgi:hypothetical protein